ncbi:coiled-coil domain-containing protein 42 homolog [Anneissia japonica]|uniref:coiled-coil domain-containing protein 42 homolog n=1 Tax=Anneissia japonica TaxID=1529436 RepID=UPI0014259836|nr:coiled-coil domain-containing protein 42 homolog [Anneissia japonica]
MTSTQFRSLDLELDPQKRSIFVTQLGERGFEEEEEEKEDINKYPIVKESAGKLIETGLNTVQKTLLLKRQVEVERVSLELQAKRNDFKKRMESCERKRIEMQKRQQKMKDRVQKFEKFIQDNEAKRRRAIHKYQTELRLKEQKTQEFEMLKEQLEDLKDRHKLLCEKLERYKKFEEYLTRVLDNLPENYLEVNNESMLTSIMDRHKTLTATNANLIDKVASLYDGVEQENQTFEEMKYNQNQNVLVINRQLAELQSVQEQRLDETTQLEQIALNRHDSFRQQSELLGRIKMAITNLAEKCWTSHNPPIESADYYQKLTQIMEYSIERIGVEKMARAAWQGSHASVKDEDRNSGRSRTRQNSFLNK